VLVTALRVVSSVGPSECRLVATNPHTMLVTASRVMSSVGPLACGLVAHNPHADGPTEDITLEAVSSTVCGLVATNPHTMQKLVRILPHAKFLDCNNDRHLFTKHGLHRNTLGKYLVASQIACHILTIFHHRAS
jgi:hypothetical protein